MPSTPIYSLPFEDPDDLPGHTLTGGLGGTDPILAEEVEEELSRIDSQLGRFRAPETFTSSGTWTNPNDGFVAIRVRVQAAGGGGGGAAATSGSDERSAGEGGSAGGYSEAVIPAGSLGATETVTIGAAGTGGNGVDGGDADPASFGAFITCNGGLGGDTNTGTGGQGTNGPLGGTASGGDINIQGGDGAGTVRKSGANVATSGYGGSCQWGKGGPWQSIGNTTLAGVDARGFGAGGGGSANLTNQSANVGGDGAPGLVVIDYIY